MINLFTPIEQDQIDQLKSGDLVYITGTIYTGRDAAHKKLVELLDKNEELPIDLRGQVIYFVGPTPAKPGRVIGSCGPTSSYRMDSYSTKLMKYGLKVMIGKGSRGEIFLKDMLHYKGVYLQAVGGLGALLSERVKAAEVVAFEDLGPEAIFKLEVVNFPAVVTYDVLGGNLIRDGINQYKRR